MVHEALLYEKEVENRVRCGLCAHRCRIDPGECGVCGVRENREGVLYSLVYGAILAENVDPIEKKPLFHLLPGSRSFSIAAAGCNFCCSFCQNHEISQMPRERGQIVGRERTPVEVVEQALRSGSRWRAPGRLVPGGGTPVVASTAATVMVSRKSILAV